MTRYRYSDDGLTPRKTSLANMNGRRYRLPSSVVGIQSRSTLISSCSEARNSSSGSGAIAIRSAEVRNRAALASGRNMVTPPPAVWYALSPSKISCA